MQRANITPIDKTTCEKKKEEKVRSGIKVDSTRPDDSLEDLLDYCGLKLVR